MSTASSWLPPHLRVELLDLPDRGWRLVAVQGDGAVFDVEEVDPRSPTSVRRAHVRLAAECWKGERTAVAPATSKGEL